MVAATAFWRRSTADSSRAAGKAAPCEILLRIVANRTNVFAAKSAPQRAASLLAFIVSGVVLATTAAPAQPFQRIDGCVYKPQALERWRFVPCHLAGSKGADFPALLRRFARGGARLCFIPQNEDREGLRHISPSSSLFDYCAKAPAAKAQDARAPRKNIRNPVSRIEPVTPRPPRLRD